jgi:hypothetical protein
MTAANPLGRAARRQAERSFQCGELRRAASLPVCNRFATGFAGSPSNLLNALPSCGDSSSLLTSIGCVAGIARGDALAAPLPGCAQLAWVFSSWFAPLSGSGLAAGDFASVAVGIDGAGRSRQWALRPIADASGTRRHSCLTDDVAVLHRCKIRAHVELSRFQWRSGTILGPRPHYLRSARSEGAFRAVAGVRQQRAGGLPAPFPVAA